MSAVTPPHSTTCSPNRSLSVSSRTVVGSTPARVQPMPAAYARASARAWPRASRPTATSAGTPRAASPRRPARPQAYDDADARVAQVERVGVSLAAVTDDRDGTPAQACAVGVGVVVHPQ